MYKTKETYILTSEALCLLACGVGYKRLWGLPLHCGNVDRKSVLKTIQQLIKSHIIKAEENSFRIMVPYINIINQIGQAEKLICIRTKNDMLSEYCCYAGDKLLVCEVTPQQNNMLRMMRLSPEQLWDHLVENGYFPKEDEEPAESIDKDEPAAGYASVWISVDVYQKGNVLERQLMIVEHPLYFYISLKERCDAGTKQASRGRNRCADGAEHHAASLNLEKRFIFTIDDMKNLFIDLFMEVCK